MRKRLRRIGRVLLSVASAGILLLALTAFLVIACNRRDAPPPDLAGLESPQMPDVPANSNGFYCVREAVRDAWVPASTTRLAAVWVGACDDIAGVRTVLASNALALAWIDRAAACGRIAPPLERRPEDDNRLGWAPVSICGRLLRLRADIALSEGRTNDVLRDYARSLQLARLYLECPPASEADALAAFVEVRNVLHALRDIGGKLDARLVSEHFGGNLRVLSDLSEPRRRAAAAALAADRRELEHLRRIADGTEPAPIFWDSPFASILPDPADLAEGNWVERMAIGTMNRLPTNYRIHPNRTLAVMARVRRGGGLPPTVQLAADARCSSAWTDVVAPAWRLLGPNGLGEIYIIIQAERQTFIEGGARLAECAARGTRLALALRLCEQEYGQLPERLDALAPRWIEAVPVDPYDGQPFRYDRARRLVYSVGANRRDDSGRRSGRADDVLFPIIAP